jgi:hypothetical protein
MSLTIGPKGRRKTLWIAGIIAVSLHGLLLSFLHLRERRPRDVGLLSSRDNTAELLQFSSQPISVTPLGEQISPPSPPLPPPSGSSSNPLRPRDHRAAAQGQVRAQPDGPASGGISMTRQSRSLTRRRGAEGQKPSRGRGQSSEVARDLAATSKVDVHTDWADALGRLKQFAEQEPPPSQPVRDGGLDRVSEATPASLTTVAIRLAKDSPLRQAYQGLWSKARPHVLSPSNRASANKEDAVEVREVSWQQVRASEVPIRHGQLVVFPENVLLFWLQGDHLFLLQSAKRWEARS